MSTVSFVKKKSAGHGNFEYEYKCKCSSGESKPNVKVTCGNDNEAAQLAEEKCNKNCGEELQKSK